MSDACAGFALSIGIYTGGIAFVAGHELEHKKSRIEQAMGKVSRGFMILLFFLLQSSSYLTLNCTNAVALAFRLAVLSFHAFFMVVA